MEHVGLQELEQRYPHLLVIFTAEPGNRLQPVLVHQLLTRDSLGYLEQLLRDQPLQCAEGLPFEGCPNLKPLCPLTFAENQLAERLKRGSGGSASFFFRSSLR